MTNFVEHASAVKCANKLDWEIESEMEKTNRTKLNAKHEAFLDTMLDHLFVIFLYKTNSAVPLGWVQLTLWYSSTNILSATRG